jgi:23S rRNA G2069 N7-methylase RlmK/C1962 C5-methylase RlmI
MVAAAAKALGVEPAKVFCKRRSRQRGTSQYEKLDERQAEIVANEGNLRFLVNLSDYLDTGLFLDHRITRGMVRDEARSAHVLNLFCYTGSFTVYAAAGGAKSTTSVDLSNTYLDWARRNLELNGFGSRRHRLVHQDVLTFLQRDTGGGYDLAVVDPPTFSNSKSAQRDWDVQRHHGELLNLLIARMRGGGIIYFSTNSRRFRLDEQGINAPEVRDITRQTLPDDFRNQRIHKVFRIVCPGG